MNASLNAVTQNEVDDLHQRLSNARRARLPKGMGSARGLDADFLATLIGAWRDHYDWRIHEARIHALPWETLGSDAEAVRVVHQRAATPDAPAVLLLHGWPDCVLRFERVLPLLHELNVVVPALPGYPFSPKREGVGTNIKTMAAQIAEAMRSLGYERYVVSGGDVGTEVSEQLAAMHPDRVAALHLTNISPLHAAFADRSKLDTEDLEYLDRVAAWQRKEGGYIAEQSTKPHTLAPALADSPAGLAAWLSEKLQGWAGKPFPDDVLLTWISAYWFTNTIGSSFTPYVDFVPPVPYVGTPTVLSVFAQDFKNAPRSFAARFVNVQEYIEHSQGGHFAAWEQPELYVADLRRALAMAFSTIA